MTTSKQSAAAKKNVKHAANTAKRKKTIAHLPKAVRTALGKKGAKAASEKKGLGIGLPAWDDFRVDDMLSHSL